MLWRLRDKGGSYMCTTVWDARKEPYEEISSVGEMRELCGSIVVSTLYAGMAEGDFGDNDCLCGVNIPETLMSSGFSVTEDDEMPGDWKFK